jgi:hypothetical protein
VSTCTIPTPIRVAASFEVLDLIAHWDSLQPKWDEFVDAHPKGNVFHTSEIVRVYEHTKGHRPLAIAAVADTGEILALLVATRVQTLPNPLGAISSRSIWYAEPLCFDDDLSIAALAKLVGEHDHIMQRNTLFTEIRPLFAPGAERIALEQCGYQYLDYLNYIIDLSGDHDAVWKRMRRDARRSVQKSEKAGCIAYEVDAASSIEPLYQFLQLSYHHAGVPMADISLFHSAVKYLQGRIKLRVTAVKQNDEVLTMGATLTYKDLSFDWYCGTVRRPQFSPVDYLKWHEFCRSQNDGCTKFDMGGAGWPDEAYGVRDFKAKFGGALVQFGRYRKTHAPWKLALAERVYQFKRKLQRGKAK